jgi:serine/threonine protein kinase/Flp pilus assembly protein TadD
MTLATGTTLGPYEILAPIGAGGMGEVYRARDPRLGREVAVKVLPAALAGNAGRIRLFEQEARAIGALAHPNILVVHDTGTCAGTPYVVSELLEGENLARRLAGGPLPVRKALEYAVQVAQGLAAAHAKGIVHRDLKPENLWVTTDEHVKILDFGLAKLSRPEPTSGEGRDPAASPPVDTTPGTILGTVGYMSPEQVQGRPADHRSDIFAFGAILHEMLFGRRAFSGDTPAETMYAILRHDPLEALGTERPVPAAVETILRRCLEKSPGQRFQSARDLAFDLEATLSSDAAAGSRATRPWPRLRAAAIAVLLLAAGGALLTSRTRRAASTSERKSLAVLHFENLSPDPENAFFADGITYDLLAQLATIRDLKVVSRPYALRYGTQRPIGEVAAELGVGVVLEGSVRRVGDRVRIVSQLVDARTERQLWAATYDRDLRDVFAIQSDVAQRIAAALRAELLDDERARIDRRPTRSLAAYDLYLKGRELYYGYRTEDNEQAIAHFRKALEQDPGFALAHAGLGDAYAQRVVRFGHPIRWLDDSVEASHRALALDPELAEGHKALGLAWLTQGRLRQALEAGRRAVELKPSFGAAVGNVGITLFDLGRLDEALVWAKRSAELCPENPVVWAEGLGDIHAAVGDPLGAEAAFRRASALQPAPAARALIAFYIHQGRRREALEEARHALSGGSEDLRLLYIAGVAEMVGGDEARALDLFERLLPRLKGQRRARLDAGVETYVAYLYARAGRHTEAKTLLKEALEADRQHLASGNEHWGVPLDMACAHALRGENDDALRWLAKAIEAGWRGFPSAGPDVLLASLRNDQRFLRLRVRLDGLLASLRRATRLG